MTTTSLLYKSEIAINDDVKIRIPLVGEVLDRQDEYYSIISMLVATPFDMMVQLDDIHVDFTKIDDYELFLMLFREMADMDTSLVFGNLDLKKFVHMINPQNGMVVLRDNTTGVVIDKGIYLAIGDAVRTLHHLKKEHRRPGNDESKDYLIQRARIKMKRRKNHAQESQLEELIVSLVNTEQFHYGFNDVKDLTIYQFNESVQQVMRKIEFDNRMHGIYAGTINAKELSQDDLIWLKHQ